jgi:bacterioferritin
MLTDRIIQLGGVPIISPEGWLEETNCGYDAPADPNVKKLVEQNIKGEQCAISVYNKLLEFVKDKDQITYNIVLSILTDEVEHEEDLENLLEDMKTAVK